MILFIVLLLFTNLCYSADSSHFVDPGRLIIAVIRKKKAESPPLLFFVFLVSFCYLHVSLLSQH